MNQKDESPECRIEARLREAELWYRTIFEQSPYGVLIIDTRGVPLEFNEEAHRQLGYTREEFAKLRIADIDPFQTPGEIQDSIKKVLRNGKAEFEVKHRTKNGEIRDVHVSTKVMTLLGRPVFQTIWQDITESRRAADELSTYRQHLEELVQERTAELKRLNEQLQLDIIARTRVEEERERLITDLRKALSEIKVLRGLIPVCAWCKKIRDDQGYWQKIEKYVEKHSHVKFTHGICPECLKKVEKKEAAKTKKTGGRTLKKARVLKSKGRAK